MYKVTAILPLITNDGASNLSHIKSIEQEIARSFGGYTTTHVSGGWFDEASREFYQDVSERVETLVESIAQVNDLLARSEQWARDLQQISLLVTWQYIEARFVAGTREQAA